MTDNNCEYDSIFISNKYTQWYKSIINAAKQRDIKSLNCYTEKHHIIPKSLGGSNCKNNIVTLLPREHYICHLLLTQMLTGKNRAKMIFSLSLLKGKTTHNSHVYNALKVEGNKMRTGTYNHFYGKKHTNTSKSKIGARCYIKQSGGYHTKSKKVNVNGNEFACIHDAVRSLGIPHSTISDVLKNRTKHSTRVFSAYYIV